MPEMLTTKERPILFAGDLVRKILDGVKTGTRRPLTPQPVPWRCDAPGMEDIGGLEWRGYRYESDSREDIETACPLGRAGDRLWVKETWAPDGDGGACWFRAGVPVYEVGSRRRLGAWDTHDRLMGNPVPSNVRWRPSIHMPRWASRITLEITDVRVEQVQDLTRSEAEREGFRDVGDHDPVACFRDLWDQFYSGRGLGWDKNPWVWAVSFRRIEPEATPR